MITQVGRDLSQQSIGDHCGHGHVQSAPRFRHFDFQTQAQIFFFGNHQALRLCDRLVLSKLEFESNRLPRGLQFTADDAHDALENLFFDSSNFAAQIASLALPSKQQVNDWEGNGQVELQHGYRPRRHQIARCQISSLGETLKEFAVGQVLRGNQPALEGDAQIGSDCIAQVAGKNLVQLVDGAHLLTADLPRLANIPGLHDLLALALGAMLAAASSSYHRIDFSVLYPWHPLDCSGGFRARRRLGTCKHCSHAGAQANHGKRVNL